MTSDDPLKGSGMAEITIPILLLDEEWQQLREEALKYGVPLKTMVTSHIRGHLVRTAVDARRATPLTWPTAPGPPDSE
jgi:hypothetical protein